MCVTWCGFFSLRNSLANCLLSFFETENGLIPFDGSLFFRIDIFQGCYSVVLRYVAGLVLGGLINMSSFRDLKHQICDKSCLEKLEFCIHLANIIKSIQLHSSKSTVEKQKF